MADNRQALFDAFVEYLLSVVKQGHYTTTNNDDEEIKIPLDSTFLQCVRAFLKDFPPDGDGVMWGDEAVTSYLNKLPFGEKKPKERKPAGVAGSPQR